MENAAVVLAAGKGTRMKSEKPKVLHNVCGKPMVLHVLNAVKKAGISKTVAVVGHQGQEVEKILGETVKTVYQHEQLGTAHAVLQARGVLEGEKGYILVVCGDTPLVSSDTLSRLMGEAKKAGTAVTVLTAKMDNPSGYGRIIRDEQGNVSKIVEEKDAEPGELSVNEINTGIYCFAAEGFFEALASLDADNAQGEYYLTDIIEYYNRKGRKVSAASFADPVEIQGINDRRQLAAAEKNMRRIVLENLMLSGVTVVDPDNTYVDSEVEIGRDTVIYPFSIIEGKTQIGENCTIGPYSRLLNVKIGSDVEVENSTVSESNIGDGCSIGPYTYVRPGCKLGHRVKIGDFVELKKAVVNNGSKVPHLSYVGDCDIGEDVNVGAGTITCNYDGKDKHHTYIDDGAFIGSNTNLVAPVHVGKKALIGAGSTITKDVPSDTLAVARNKQKTFAKGKFSKDDKK